MKNRMKIFISNTKDKVVNWRNDHEDDITIALLAIGTSLFSIGITGAVTTSCWRKKYNGLIENQKH